MSWSPPADEVKEVISWSPPTEEVSTASSWQPPQEEVKQSNTFSDMVPQVLKDAFGGVESIARMIPNTPQMAYGAGIDFVGKFVPEKLQKDYQELASKEVESFPHIKPLTHSGEMFDEMLGTGFKHVARAPGAAVQAAIQGGGTSGAQALVDDPTAIGPALSEIPITVGGLIAGAKAIPGQLSSASSFIKNPLGKSAEKPLTYGKIDPEWESKGGISEGERTIMSKAASILDDKMVALNEKIKGFEEYVERTGDASPEVLQALTEHESHMKKLVEDMAKLEDDMSGNITEQITTEQALAREARKNEIMQRLKEDRVAKEPKADTVVEEIKPEEITLDDSTLPKELPEDPIIAREAVLPPDEVIPPITNKAMPTGVQVANMLRDHSTVGEVFATLRKEGVGTKGQQLLLQILDRIPHVKNAAFKFGQASQDSQGRWSKGAYDGANHVMELHKDGNIKTILHEGVHAATHALLNEAKNVHAIALGQIYETLKTNKTAEHYGLTNVHEMVSEALTNPKFKAYLQEIKSARGPLGKKSISLWTDFKNIIKDALSENKTIRTVLDDVLEHGEGLIETAKRTPEERFQRLAEKQHAEPPVPSMGDAPTPRAIRGAFSRNAFGVNALEGFFRDHPMVQQAFRTIREAGEDSARITNQLLNGTNEVLASGKMHVWNTLAKVQAKTSPAMVLKQASKIDLATVHDLFRRGFEEKMDYAANLKQYGQHLTPDQVAIYNTLSNMFKGMHSAVTGVQTLLGKKHVLPYRDGWYPAARVGKYTVELAYEGNRLHVQSFKTAHAADLFRKQITDGKNLKHITVSDVIDASKKELVQPNAEMAAIIGDTLAQKYPSAAPALQKTIDNLMHSMQTRGGKLGFHHQHRMNLGGYKGSELFKSAAEQGDAFREGIMASLGDFTTNLKALNIRHKLEGLVNDEGVKAQDPVGHAAISQMYDSALNRNKEFFEGVSDTAANAVDKGVNATMLKLLGKEFQAGEHATTRASNAAMGVFYATKMMAKIGFSVIGQIFTIPTIIGEMARGSTTGLGAMASFAKGSTKFWTGDKVLWEHLKDVSQTFDTMSAQFLESMNISKHSDAVTRTDKVINFTRDYLLLGEVGARMDSFSRLYSYAMAYTHYLDRGMPKSEASYQARLATDKAMNTYGKAESAPMFTSLGPLGTGMKPLSSFGLNSLGNLVSYLQDAKKGNTGPLIAMGLTTTLMGGVLSLPFIQEYERYRKVLSKFFNIDMPSVLEVMSRDTSFLSRLNITPEDERAVKLYGVPALSGIDLSASIRSNETLFSIAAAIAIGEEDFGKLAPIWGATVDTGLALGSLGAAGVKGGVSVGDKRTAIDSLISGHWGYGAKELAGVNTTQVGGNNTDMKAIGKKGLADSQRTNMDIVAGILGSKTIDQKYGDAKNFELTEKDRLRQARVGKVAGLFVEAGPKDRQRYVDKMVKDLDMTESEIEGAITNASLGRILPQEVRYYVNAVGNAKERQVKQLMKWGK